MRIRSRLPNPNQCGQPQNTTLRVRCGVERSTYVFGDFTTSVRVGQSVLELVLNGYSVQRYAAVVDLGNMRKLIRYIFKFT